MPVSPHRLAPLLTAAAALAVPLASLAAQPGAPDRAQSRYWTMPAAVSLLAATALRSETIVLSQPGKLLVEADGNAQPTSWPTAAQASIYITVDGVPVTNTALVDWKGSVAPQPHSFNAVGTASVTAGTHVVVLQANAPNGGYDLGSANLSVFVNPAQNVVQAQTAVDSAEIMLNFTGTPGASRCTWGSIPWKELFRIEMPTQAMPVYVFASGSAQVTRNAGDAMSSVFHAGSNDTRNETSLTWRTTYTVQDLYPAAEIHGSMFCQGILYGSPPSTEYRPTFQFAASELPPSHLATQPLGYKAPAGAG